MPIKKEGTTSTKEISFGRKAIKVTSLNMLNMARKITSRLVTHKIVFGILNLDSIEEVSFTHSQRSTKE
jgi:hypothetical protein